MEVTQNGLQWWILVLTIFRYRCCNLRDISVQRSSVVGKCESLIGINSKTIPFVCNVMMKLDTP